MDEIKTEAPRVGRPPKTITVKCVVKCLYNDIVFNPGDETIVTGEVPVNFEAVQ